MKSNPLVARLALASPEGLRSLSLSLAETARLARVSRPTLATIERCRHTRADLIVRVVLTLLTLELQRPAVEPIDAMQLAPSREVQA